MRQKWKESALLSGILVLSAGLVYGGLSHWKRTPHLYEYDRNQIKEQEKNPELVQQGEQQEENKRERQKPKNNNNQQNRDTDQQEKDDENDNEQDTFDSDNQRSDANGDDAMDGDGAPGDSNVPNMNLPSGAPAGTPTPVDEGEPTASPAPTETAEPKKTPEPEPEKDKVVKLTCTWPDRKELLYGEKIPQDTIQVTAEYSSGEKKQISSSEYTIRQLKNDSVGEHTMTVSYNKDESVSCNLVYTVNNFTKSLTYSWPTKDQCYKGEEFPSEAITVKTKMADGTTKTTTKYEITGYNNMLVDVDQKFKITYKDTTINKSFTVEGTCRFYNRKITLHCYYYSDAEMEHLVDKRTYNGDYDYYENETISLRTLALDDDDAYYKKKRYTLKEVSLAEIDSAGNSKNKSLPYKVKERFFDAISLTKKYVLAE